MNTGSCALKSHLQCHLTFHLGSPSYSGSSWATAAFLPHPQPRNKQKKCTVIDFIYIVICFIIFCLKKFTLGKYFEHFRTSRSQGSMSLTCLDTTASLHHTHSKCNPFVLWVDRVQVCCGRKARPVWRPRRGLSVSQEPHHASPTLIKLSQVWKVCQLLS